MNSEEILKFEVATRKQGEVDGIQKYATGMACISGGKVLVVKRADDDFLGGMFELPGGGVDAGETFERGVIRETLEETGLTVTSIMQAYRAFDYVSQSGKPTRQINFIVECSQGDVELSQEHTAFKWIARNELPSIQTTDEMRLSIEEVFEKL